MTGRLAIIATALVLAVAVFAVEVAVVVVARHAGYSGPPHTAAHVRTYAGSRR